MLTKEQQADWKAHKPAAKGIEGKAAMELPYPSALLFAQKLTPFRFRIVKLETQAQ